MVNSTLVQLMERMESGDVGNNMQKLDMVMMFN